jgi:hypothetical protein
LPLAPAVPKPALVAQLGLPWLDFANTPAVESTRMQAEVRTSFVIVISLWLQYGSKPKPPKLSLGVSYNDLT